MRVELEEGKNRAENKARLNVKATTVGEESSIKSIERERWPPI